MTPSDAPAERLPSDLLRYPRLNELEIELRWSKDWWDGPVNGSASYQGGRSWFEFYCDADDEGSDYLYLLYPLSDEQADSADAWFEANERMLDEWRRLADDPAAMSSAASRSLAAKLKSHDAELPDFCSQPPVGWFTSGFNAAFYAIQVHPGNAPSA